MCLVEGLPLVGRCRHQSIFCLHTFSGNTFQFQSPSVRKYCLSEIFNLGLLVLDIPTMEKRFVLSTLFISFYNFVYLHQVPLSHLCCREYKPSLSRFSSQLKFSILGNILVSLPCTFSNIVTSIF